MTFGASEDAVLAAGPWRSHSALVPALDLGLLHPRERAQAAEQAYREGRCRSTAWRAASAR